MNRIKRLLACVSALCLLGFTNILLIWQFCDIGIPLKIALTVLLSLWYLGSLFRISGKHAGSRRLGTIAHGLRLLRYYLFCSLAEPLLYLGMIPLTAPDSWEGWAWLGGNFLFFAVFTLITAIGGLLRLGIAGRQVKWYWYLFLYLVCWMPLINLIPFVYIYRTAKREYLFESAKEMLDDVRRENEICKTKYPVLMVHGIFFRDWQLFNYWGRIPAALKKNGAQVYYGKQQSAQSIADSAKELAAQMQSILAETGAEKLNIIAHSKGGLDTRYAMKELGMAQYVASLTTINTPHHGCAWVDGLLEKIPQHIAEKIAAHYEKIFRGLGDQSPDFLAGVRDLTAANCAVFHASHPIEPEIPHHCIMSEMRNALSAPFPLWLGYLCIKKQNRNDRCDGLVPVDSARLEGARFTMIPKTKFRGISHGDMIDLNRENIEDFDVREFYVGIVKELKERGL